MKDFSTTTEVMCLLAERLPSNLRLLSTGHVTMHATCLLRVRCLLLSGVLPQVSIARVYNYNLTLKRTLKKGSGRWRA